MERLQQKNTKIETEKSKSRSKERRSQLLNRQIKSINNLKDMSENGDGENMFRQNFS